MNYCTRCDAPLTGYDVYGFICSACRTAQKEKEANDPAYANAVKALMKSAGWQMYEDDGSDPR
jgi:hypothetical protein